MEVASRLISFLSELKRRKVYHVAVVYVVVGVGILGAAEVILDPLGLESLRPYLVILVFLGFPIALVFAWAFEVQPESPPSASRDSAEPPAPSIPSATREPLSRNRASSIAVLSFVDMSPDRDQEYFCDGMAEEIINGLTKVKGLRVAARTSSFYFKGRQEHIRDIGNQLAVGTILEGSVRRSGDRLRVTAQLVSVEDGYHLWSENFDRELEDVFEVQDEIARSIVETLRPTLLDEEERGPDRELVVAPTKNLEAYDHYLLGTHLWEGRSRNSLASALRHFEKAIELDPEFVLPHTGIADAYTALGIYGYLPPDEARRRAGSAARRALKLDDSLAEPHASMGFYHVFADWDWEKAEKELSRAIDLNPSHSRAQVWFGYLRGLQGRFSEAYERTDAARSLDPLNNYVATLSAPVRVYAGDFAVAADMLESVLERDPTYLWAVWLLSWTYFWMSRTGEAVQLAQKCVHLSNGAEFFKGFLGMIYGRAGMREEARGILEDLAAIRSSRYVSPLSLSWIQLGLGEEEGSIELLEEAFSEKTFFLLVLHQESLYAPVWSDPRFMKLISTVGSGVVSNAWEREGKGP